MKTGIEMVAEERVRQIAQEGWTAQHDDGHDKGEMAQAAACYALHAAYEGTWGPDEDWPWSFDEWNPKEPVRDLVRAGALIVAEIDRLQRKQKNERKPMITVRAVAEMCHETNRAYCKALGDNSQPAWAEAPEWQRTSAINGVIFHRNNPEATPDASHNSWLKEKDVAGWKYGPRKDPEKKEHPCFVPFNDLPAEQQIKDELFKAVVDCVRDLIEPAEPFSEPKAA